MIATSIRLLGICAGGLLLASSAAAASKRTMVLERAVLLMRHGIRAPLPGEIPDETRAGAPWPRWTVADSQVTPHGAKALEIAAQADRRLLAQRGLLSASGCLPAGEVTIWTNSSDRTIASGKAYGQGFAPSCMLPVRHRAIGEVDPIFELLRAKATRFDAHVAMAAINRETGGMTALVRRHRSAIALLDRVLGCRLRRTGCIAGGPPQVTPTAEGSEIQLSGPIRSTSGVAQVLLLQYVEGMPLAEVGWGRADEATLRRLGALHAALFSVFTHPPYMAAHQAALLGRHALASLSDPHGPRLNILVGHDTNVTALAAALRVDLKAPGYATNDVPPGGALLLERLRDVGSGRSYVRMSYRTQSPGTLRRLGAAVTITPLRIPGCGGPLCEADRFARLLQGRLAPLAGK
jgi:4-phytase/acid phosphatase